MRWFLFTLCFILFVLKFPVAHAQEGTYEVIFRKEQEKQASRWSLADWLAQKQSNRLADLVLAKNSHTSIYEFFFDAESYNDSAIATASKGSESNHDIYTGMVGAYAGIIGLRGGYEADTENRSTWTGSFNVRLLGRALQDTHLNLEYGLRGITLAASGSSGSTAETFQNQYGAVTLDVYLTKKFGLEGIYRRILPAQSNLNRTLIGEQEQAGVFIDFGILRVFGNWRNEFLSYDGGGQATSNEFRQGFGGGFRLYF